MLYVMVLLVLSYHGGSTSQAILFQSKAACVAAAEQFTKDFAIKGATYGVWASCAPYGETQ